RLLPMPKSTLSTGLFQQGANNPSGLYSCRLDRMPSRYKALVFPLSHTLLQVVLQQRQEQRKLKEQQQQLQLQRGSSGSPAGAAGAAAASRQPPSALRELCSTAAATAGGATSDGGWIISDCNEHLHAVHSPSRDVYVLTRVNGRRPHSMVLATADLGVLGGIGGAGGLLAGAGTVGSGAGGMAGGDVVGVLGGAGAATPGAAAGGTAAEGCSHLAVYLAFPERLPRALLEGALADTQLIMRRLIAPLIRQRFEAGLSEEWTALAAAANNLPSPGGPAVRIAASLSASQARHSLPPGLGAGGAGAAGGVMGGAPPLMMSYSAMAGTPPEVSPSGIVTAFPSPAALVAAAMSASPDMTPNGAPTPNIHNIHNNSNTWLSRLGGGAGGGPHPATATPAPYLPTSMSPPQGGASTLALASSSASNGGGGGGGGGVAGNSSYLLGMVNPLTIMGPMGGAGGAAGGGGGGMSTSELHLEGLSAGEALQQMSVLVSSYMDTLQALQGQLMACDKVTESLRREDLPHLHLLEVLGHGGGGVVFRGKLHALEVAVKVFEVPGDLATAAGLSSLQSPSPAGALPGSPTATATTAISPAATAAAGSDLPGGAAAAAGAGAGGGGDGGGDKGKAAWPAVGDRRVLQRSALELAVTASMSHPHIIQVYSLYTNMVLVKQKPPRQGTSGVQLLELSAATALSRAEDGIPCSALCMEYCDMGTLAHAIDQHRFMTLTPLGARRPALKAICTTLLEVALALRHLHARNLAHCDLKPANVLLKSSRRDSRGFTCKLADFGYVSVLKAAVPGGRPTVLPEEACGTVTHMAPETFIKGQPLDFSVDTFSFGILMWELYTCARPYADVPEDQIAQRVTLKGLRPTFPPDTPRAFGALARQCWSQDPNERPNASEVVRALENMLQIMNTQLPVIPPLKPKQPAQQQQGQQQQQMQQPSPPPVAGQQGGQGQLVVLQPQGLQQQGQQQQHPPLGRRHTPAGLSPLGEMRGAAAAAAGGGGGGATAEAAGLGAFAAAAANGGGA
ncbi:hypothetical protein Agub_g14777, partial [Astrephomene gubernaculifera]